jgi:hypothetical protein
LRRCCPSSSVSVVGKAPTNSSHCHLGLASRYSVKDPLGGGGGGGMMGGVRGRLIREKEPFVVGWAGTASSGSVVVVVSLSMARISYVARLKSSRVSVE